MPRNNVNARPRADTLEDARTNYERSRKSSLDWVRYVADADRCRSMNSYSYCPIHDIYNCWFAH